MATQQHLFEIRPQDCSRAAHERIRECKETVRLQILEFARESGPYEAADCGLLSADLAAGIRRVKE